ncbi:hypothetical protein VCHC55B2_3562B, partial [Vibrio cholerae HC-55B2]
LGFAGRRQWSSSPMSIDKRCDCNART